jgi:non-homologous end joining protein Ku
MNFKEFQKRARLYVIGALDDTEVREFEEARAQLGQKAEDFITECYRLHEAFALSLRPAKSSDTLKERLMQMVRERKEGTRGT